jgi:hypothetical protein
MSKKNATDADFIFDKAWISLHAFKETNERLAAIASALAAFPELNLAEKDDIRKRVVRKMHTKRSNSVISAKRQRIEPPAAPPPPPPPPPPPRLQITPAPRRSSRSSMTFIGTFDGRELFQLSAIHGTQNLTITPGILDNGQFYSGVLMLDTIVVKFMTRRDGARFRIGAKAERDQRAFYTEKNKSIPQWIGYSEEVQPAHKVDDEIAAMRLVHDELSALGPAIYDVATFSGTKVSSYISLFIFLNLYYRRIGNNCHGAFVFTLPFSA